MQLHCITNGLPLRQLHKRLESVCAATNKIDVMTDLKRARPPLRNVVVASPMLLL